MATKRLEVLITGNAKDAQKAFGDLERSATKSGKGTTKALSGIKSGLVGLGVGAAALGSFKAFEESEKVSKQTAAVIKSTGNEANVTADHIGDLAAEMSKLGGIDDELVQSGENALLRFKNVRNEVGKGNDIFDQATLAANNYAAATGKDVVQANVLLGKSLNDPIKAMGILNKVGVQFTADQKEQIKTLVESGDIMGAQKVILDEFSKKFGGSLEANATASGKAQVAMENMGESVGAVLAPAMEKGASVIAGLASAFTALPSGAQSAIVGIGGISAAAIYAGPKVAEMAGTLSDLAVRGREAAKNLIVPKAAVEGLGGATAVTQNLNSTLGSTVGTAAAAGAGIFALGSIVWAWGEKQQKAAAQAAALEAGIGSLRQAAVSQGKTIDDVFESSLAERISGNAQATKDWDINARELTNAIKGGSDAFDTYQLAMMDSERASGGSTRSAVELGFFLKQLQKEYVGASGSVEQYRQVEQQLTSDKKITIGALAEQARLYGDVTDEVMGQVDAMQQLNHEMQTHIDLARDSVGAALSEREAHDRVQDSMLALADARNSGNAEQIQRAQDDLTQSILGEAAAADEAARKSAELAGKQYGAAESTLVQKARLQELATQTGFNSNEMQWFAAQLDNAARQRQVNLDTAQASANIDALVRKIMDAGLGGVGGVTGAGGDVIGSGVSGILGALGPARASGGSVFAGGYNLVGERGPEIVKWGANGTVIPAAKTKQMLSGTSVNAGTASMGGGGNTYITVKAENIYGIEDLAAKLAAVDNKRTRMIGRSDRLVSTSMARR